MIRASKLQATERKQKMKYVVKDEWQNCYLCFSRFVRDMDVICIAERKANYKNATAFDSVEDANASIEELHNYHTYETGGCVIKNVEEIEAGIKADAKKKSDAILKNAWKNSSDKTKKEMLDKMSDEKKKEWLETVEANAN